jgi:flagellin-like protein
MKASSPIIGLLLMLAVIVGCKQNKNRASAQNVGATIAGNNQKAAEAPITSRPTIKDIPLDYGLNDDEYIA